MPRARAVWVFCAFTLCVPGGARALPAGLLDPTFGVGGRVSVAGITTVGSGVVVQPDGKILVAGGSGGGIFLTRYLADGTPDASFGTGGLVAAPQSVRIAALALQPDGKLLVAGSTSDPDNFFHLARFNANGSVDFGFGTSGRVITDLAGADDYAFALVVQPDGRIVLAGTTSAPSIFALARYLADGTADGSFGSGGVATTAFPGTSAEAHGLALQPDGKLVAAGFASGQFALARYLSDGTLDATFGTGGQVTTSFGVAAEGRAVVVQPDGRIVAAGKALVTNGDFALARYDASGTLDPTFGTGGLVTTAFPQAAEANALLLQPDGQLVAAGGILFLPYGFAAARYRTDGTLDPSFGDAGVVTTLVGNDGHVATAVARQGDGKLILAGDFTVARYLGPTCGNGAPEGGEDCDDGNTVGGDGCDPACCTADGDADGQCDAVDPCTGGVPATAARIKVVGPRSRLTLAGELPLPVPLNPGLDPLANGIRFRLDNPTRNLLDVTIAGGAFVDPPRIGWTARANTFGTKWVWVDRTGFPQAHVSPAGVFKIKVEDRSNISPGHVRYVVKGAFAYQTFGLDLPLSATVVLDPPTAASGQCGTATFPGPEPAPSCALKNGGANVICK